MLSWHSGLGALALFDLSNLADDSIYRDPQMANRKFFTVQSSP